MKEPNLMIIDNKSKQFYSRSYYYHFKIGIHFVIFEPNSNFTLRLKACIESLKSVFHNARHTISIVKN